MIKCRTKKRDKGTQELTQSNNYISLLFHNNLQYLRKRLTLTRKAKEDKYKFFLYHWKLYM